MTVCPKCHAILPTHNSWCPDVQPPPVYSNAANAADVTREPTGGQGLREAIVRGLARAHGASYVEWADAVLALPELAALIADAERVQRVRELAHSWGHPLKPDHHWCADRLLRALDGEPQP